MSHHHKPVLHPVFIDRSWEGQGRAATPQHATEAIVNHLLLIDENSERAVRTALQMFAVQCVAYVAGVLDQAKTIGFPKDDMAQRNHAYVELYSVLQAMATTADERASAANAATDAYYQRIEGRAPADDHERDAA